MQKSLVNNNTMYLAPCESLANHSQVRRRRRKTEEDEKDRR